MISGDTLLIRAQKGVNGPPTEQQITLTMIQAPRLARRAGNRDTDNGEATQDEVSSYWNHGGVCVCVCEWNCSCSRMLGRVVSS